MQKQPGIAPWSRPGWSDCKCIFRSQQIAFQIQHLDQRYLATAQTLCPRRAWAFEPISGWSPLKCTALIGSFYLMCHHVPMHCPSFWIDSHYWILSIYWILTEWCDVELNCSCIWIWLRWVMMGAYQCHEPHMQVIVPHASECPLEKGHERML